MYYHIIPRYFADTPAREIRLANLEIPELGLKLSDKELKTVKPYSNRRYSIGCLRHGLRGRNFIGLVVESELVLFKFTKICSWTVYPQPRNVPDIAFRMTHTTKYRLLGNNHQIFSEDLLLTEMPSSVNIGPPEIYCGTSVMEFCAPYCFTGVNVQDKHDLTFNEFYETEGVIIHREQEIETYTTSVEDYQTGRARNRMKWPSLETALKFNNA